MSFKIAIARTSGGALRTRLSEVWRGGGITENARIADSGILIETLFLGRNPQPE
jgi:hypothetical protein